MTFELARVFEAVRGSGNIDSVVLGGGASKALHFRKLIAALFSPLPALQQTDEELSTARGAIFAFSPAAARSKTRKISPVSGSQRTRILEAYERYLVLFDKFYGDIHAGKAFTFRRGEK